MVSPRVGYHPSLRHWFTCKNACTNGIVTRSRIEDRGSRLDDRQRRFFSVKIYRTSIPWHNSRWKDRLRRIIRRVIFHVNAQRELPPFEGMTYVRTELYLVRLSADVGTDVPQEFLVPDKRRRIMNPHEPDRSLKGSRSEATVDRCQWFEVAISVGTYKNRLPNDLYARINSSLRGRLD